MMCNRYNTLRGYKCLLFSKKLQVCLAKLRHHQENTDFYEKFSVHLHSPDDNLIEQSIFIFLVL